MNLSRWISMVTLGVILMFAGFDLVNKSLSNKYGEIDSFKAPYLAIETNIELRRDENFIIINFPNKEIKIPFIIELRCPLLTK